MTMKDWSDFEAALSNGANIEDLLGLQREETNKVPRSPSDPLSKGKHGYSLTLTMLPEEIDFMVLQPMMLESSRSL